MLSKNCMFVLLLSFTSQIFAVEPITTEGNQVLIGGQNGSLAGNSFYWTNFNGSVYYNRNVVSWLKEDWNTTIVRAAMGVQEFNGFLSNPNLNRNAVIDLVEAAIAEDIYVIIDWHSHSAENNTAEAVQFFSEMAQLYGSNENVLFEIYNEPIGDFNGSEATWNTIRNYAMPVIAAIREHSDNLIIVGTPFFSQRVDTASRNPITGVENLAYTFHFYAGTHGEELREYARTALRNGIPLFATEWGTVNADGNGGANEGSTREWMDFLLENNISHLNWSVNDLNEGASILRTTGAQGQNTQGNWPLSLLRESGVLTRDIIRNWPAVGTGSGSPIEPDPIDPPPTDPDTPVPERVSLPNLIQAENYNRQSGVLTEGTNDIGGGLNIGFIENNDYVEYDVTVAESGVYNFDFRFASNTQGGDATIFVDGQNRGEASVGSTGGWQSWVTVGTQVTLDEGDHTIRVIFTNQNSNQGLLNVNWINVTNGTASVDPEPTPPDSDLPMIPSLIQAEDYVRQSGTQTENTSDIDGGQNIAFITHNDYLEFDVNVVEAGSYNLDLRLASNTGGGNVLFQVDGQALTQVSIGSTGGWQSWVTASAQLQLAAGEQTIRLLFSEPNASSDLMNINWMNVTRNAPSVNLLSIPSLIQAEDFSRQSGVQTEATADINGGLNIGFIENNDYVEYDVNVAAAGNYTVDFRLASNNNGGDIFVQVNGQTSAQASVDFTGGWQEWVTVSTQIQLEVGDQTLRLLFSDPNSSAGLMNVNWINFTRN
ncbi:carbohydrate-binding protein [Alteromonas sp. 5E99-2]|uniref:carbohydrate-binding protein n=1 Tax=Alteromonas sp. 5E99-2 TaxID=2817683 RepID=UPI001A992657|nr:carbohydrate-binding protein [Alteromonas sp. 5E99-2]MBO1256244.1 carbohydrate-binding protein [Alteromonas sp. 5E99-2]